MAVQRRKPRCPESGLSPAAPIVDEDGDGDLADEIPSAEKGDPEATAVEGSDDYPDTRLRIFRTKDFPSSIELPIIPRD